MSENSITEISKFLSYILRHHPQAIGLEMDTHGWIHIDSLIEKAKKKGKTLNREVLERVVESGTKKRFVISDDDNYIRAGYGHSIDVDLALTPQTPPDILFHGTAQKNLDNIKRQGLHSGSRNFVHLSFDKEDALNAGQRHGSPVVLSIASKRMYHSGYPFYRSESEPSIWLAEKVPEKFIFY